MGQQSELGLVFSYEILCQQIKPGDVIAFSGNDIPATVVKLATSSCYVHLAIVLSTNQDPINSEITGSDLMAELEGDRPDEYPLILLAESHISLSKPSLGTGKRNFGAQIHQLSQRLMECPDRAWWAALRQPLAEAKKQQMQRWLWEIEQQGVPYDFIQAIGAGVENLVEGCLETPRDDASLFCSELVACALQQGGAIADHINPSQQTPADVMAFSCFKPPVLLKGKIEAE
jgi:hypothetical protein